MLLYLAAMAKDYAKRKKRGRINAKSAPLPSWVWFLAGLATGLFIALLIYVGLTPGSNPLNVDGPRQVKPIPDPEANQTATDTTEQRGEIEWEFYEIFPSAEVPVSEVNPQPDKTQPPSVDAVYMLQVGSFREIGDADALRASLILEGFEASLFEAEKDGDIWHRVIVGPIEGDLSLYRMRTSLAEHNHPALTLRIR